ncbi:response regulator [Cellulophaga baltica]|uniref:response regulator n=1 Tax=Cellulophaga TaxID=104264 RepID=UPI001C07DC64|nr:MULTISPECIES: response regulator [Cellulophaga]MBU2996927.1 response regulator [Cellulophaga baltica]MDO6768325.1 response regulator [Cellulophaga sp. 1_MG-2023]
MNTTDYIEVLLVEDRPEDAELTIRSLKENNFMNKIKLIEDGQEALDYLFGEGIYEGARPELPKLLLLDLKLPKVSGLEVLERIRDDEKLKHLPVVILTSSNENMDIETAYKLGANSYIVKPVDFINFAQAIKEVGMYWLVLNRSLNK